MAVADLDAALLVLTELVTNEVVHGIGSAINVRVAFFSGGVRFAVPQNSLPADAAAPIRDTDPYDESGRGLLLVESFADTWGTDNGWTWCVLSVLTEGAE
ncbi:ATP-binding protein [Streptomyces sp. PmtG]